MLFKKLNMTMKQPRKFDWLLHAATIGLVCFGTLMILSTNIGNANLDPFVLIKVGGKQLIFVILSYILMTFLANNFTMERAQKYLPIIGLIIMSALFATQFSNAVLGSKAWIQLNFAGQSITIQPSEFAKVFMMIVMAVYIEYAGSNRWGFRRIMKGPFVYFLMCLIPIILQRDMGTLIVFILLMLFCFLIPSHKGLRTAQKVVKIGMAVGVVAAIILMSDIGIRLFNSIEPLKHIAVRIENAQNPFLDPYQNGYQLINGLYGIARGGLTGIGLGDSLQKYGYLTQSDNDFILAIVIEELGAVGLGIILLGYFILIQRLFYYAFHTKSDSYRLILFGTASYIFIHFVFNVGGVSGLIPLTGIPLLFISSGGSSLLSIMAAIGICQAIISKIRRQGAHNQGKKRKEPQKDRGSIRKGRGETKIGG